jgi:hypothetical protein
VYPTKCETKEREEDNPDETAPWGVEYRGAGGAGLNDVGFQHAGDASNRGMDEKEDCSEEEGAKLYGKEDDEEGR